MVVEIFKILFYKISHRQKPLKGYSTGTLTESNRKLKVKVPFFLLLKKNITLPLEITDCVQICRGSVLSAPPPLCFRATCRCVPPRCVHQPPPRPASCVLVSLSPLQCHWIKKQRLGELVSLPHRYIVFIHPASFVCVHMRTSLIYKHRHTPQRLIWKWCLRGLYHPSEMLL